MGPIWVYATTTSGATVRNIIVDGQIGPLLPAGSNSGTGNWETDEVFEGFMSIVNWYMTWDEDSLYIGRSGGSNSEGSVIYLQAGYNGASFVNTGFSYDSLQPGLSPMGGINFSAYFKETYDEYRNWNGSWAAPNLQLEPRFDTTSTGEHQMEVAIAWDAITGGNGKPTNLRAVFYQVVPFNTAGCPAGGSFVYGESPWGTGMTGNGPSVGVNDGVPISAAQPGGCDTGDSTATRWWGCYPVIGGVGANGWNAQQPAAGNDTTICESATAYILQGNVPPAQSQGTWTLVSQPSGSPPITFGNANAANTIVQNLTGFGDYVFTWDINYGSCPSLPDTVIITRVPFPPAAVAGADQDLLCNLDNATLGGNSPGSATGIWSLVSGSGTIANPNDPASPITSLGYGPSVFEWMISNSACPATSDQVTITRFQPPTSLAGSDQELCFVSMTSMDGIMPTLFGGAPVGTWSQVSGPSTAVFTDVNAFNTPVSNLQTGIYQFAWTISNGTCPASSDTMSVTISGQPVAEAGQDEIFCFTTDSYQLDATNPQLTSPTAHLTWTQTAGPSPATILDDTLYNTVVTGLEPGTYKFLLTVMDGVCPTETDVLTLTLYELQDQGTISITNASFGMADGAVSIADPLNGFPAITFSIDGVNFGTSSTFTDLPPGTYTAYIMDDLGCGTTFEFAIEENGLNPPPTDTLPIVAPTGFSPNGDDINDTWVLNNVDQYPDVFVEVFNEWGARVFSSEGYDTPWNGQFNGKNLPPATYYFIIYPNREGAEVQKGPLTLFR